MSYDSYDKECAERNRQAVERIAMAISDQGYRYLPKPLLAGVVLAWPKNPGWGCATFAYILRCVQAHSGKYDLVSGVGHEWLKELEEAAEYAAKTISPNWRSAC